MSVLAASIFGFLSSLLLIGFLLLPVCAWLLSVMFAVARWVWWGIFLCSVVFGAGLYVGAMTLVGMDYSAEVEAFDLDGDGAFSERELTPEAETALRRYTSDTGRSFAPLVAGPVAFLWVGFNYAMLFIGASVWRIVKGQWVGRRKMNGDDLPG